MANFVIKSRVKSLSVTEGAHSPRRAPNTYTITLLNNVVVDVKADTHKDVPCIGEPITLTLEWK